MTVWSWNECYPEAFNAAYPGCFPVRVTCLIKNQYVVGYTMDSSIDGPLFVFCCWLPLPREGSWGWINEGQGAGHHCLEY